TLKLFEKLTSCNEYAEYLPSSVSQSSLFKYFCYAEIFKFCLHQSAIDKLSNTSMASFCKSGI
ncbi:MAG: hypothetical protein U9Q80_09310, partial [Bacillota bacterium]|nr:hypothetical protein [Bacillota bacterium]